MLEVSDLKVSYGSIEALHGISFNVLEGEIVTLIGANGAGKTTTLQTLSRLLPISSGRIILRDEDITNLPPEKVVQRGLIQSPEGRRVFADQTVLDNLELGAYSIEDKELIGENLEKVLKLFPRLKERIKQYSGTLSGGEQQMLAMGRALMASPEILLLDEPSMGLAPLLVKEIFNIIQEINAAGTTVLLVEQNAHMALSIAKRAYVLETGNIALSGDAAALIESEEVKKAYLGG
jgi:branched-chain amino acid transport system ATP-binding protein